MIHLFSTTLTLGSRFLEKVPLTVVRTMSSSNRGKSQLLDIDGQRIHVTTYGSGRHPVLLMPGALGSGETDMKSLTDNSSRDMDWTLIAWDPPGYGKSRPPSRIFPSDFYVKDAESGVQTMAKLGFDNFSLAGWSDGGISALIAAAQYPSLIKKCLVWGTNAYFTQEDYDMINKVRDVSKWSPRMREPMENMYGVDGFPVLWNDWVEAIAQIMKNNGGDICKNLLGDIKCPTLIIHGDKDAMVAPEHPNYLEKNISGSILKRFPDGKHNLHLKYKKEFNELMESFFLH
ncbi:valacyclovir hydrolase [Lepeophtheirus salmonis]|uniref:Valacyclovir hydrolase n=1 Tax=Lepeophtheirus salmonis TaxID=72036 RepID=C1BS44_LEPSM|nr:valacyclovir hydrolase-like [Lepeophtheirus salmonis]ACO11847.1 Valacyclovir hydrolase precursor [Lepeophtheirus salmonis]ADD24438.1 Valacyclovir hydrolase [Lepeophtheirus salmonis]